MLSGNVFPPKYVCDTFVKSQLAVNSCLFLVFCSFCSVLLLSLSIIRLLSSCGPVMCFEIRYYDTPSFMMWIKIALVIYAFLILSRGL